MRHVDDGPFGDGRPHTEPDQRRSDLARRAGQPRARRPFRARVKTRPSTCYEPTPQPAALATERGITQLRFTSLDSLIAYIDAYSNRLPQHPVEVSPIHATARDDILVQQIIDDLAKSSRDDLHAQVGFRVRRENRRP